MKIGTGQAKAYCGKSRRILRPLLSSLAPGNPKATRESIAKLFPRVDHVESANRPRGKSPASRGERREARQSTFEKGKVISNLSAALPSPSSDMPLVNDSPPNETKCYL
ncbi:hypothetical protein TNIN_437431 [Trichonephila inaurata madagascariensis]|uniref:Uncharacterized protein n=1 Tax=Trichonephila inaurata madagascariensis TaxID=2747483 RepID=A0A8X6XJ09_9ARAC|nr:hypothetical protein TNIN_437431 [Trichonephila inaurata madagascariensis]